jgi:Zn finger protein HypA/HybF involved in hydrogenase expression
MSFYGIKDECPTCHEECSHLELVYHGECDACHDAYFDCVSTDKVGINDWEVSDETI